jgi:NAD(P)H-nitrite reductase large subunit
MTGGVTTPETDSVYRTVSHFDPNRKRYRKLVFRDDKLAGFVLVNDIEQGGELLSLIRGQTPIAVSRERLLSSSFN